MDKERIRQLNRHFCIRTLTNNDVSETSYQTNEYMPFNNPSLPVLQTFGMSTMKPAANLKLVHPYWSFHLLDTGTLSITCGSLTKVMEPGELLMVKAGIPYQLKNSGRIPVVRRWIAISNGPLISLLCDQPALSMTPVMKMKTPERFNDLLEEIRRDIERGDDHLHWNLCRHASAFLIEILAQSPPCAIQSDFEHIIYDLQRIFREHLTLQSLAIRYGVTARTLTRMFQKNIQSSPIDYVISLRINYARRLLTTTTLPISQISEQSGFNSLSFFARTFQKRQGMSPKEYRDNNNKSMQMKRMRTMAGKNEQKSPPSRR